MEENKDNSYVEDDAFYESEEECEDEYEEDYEYKDSFEEDGFEFNAGGTLLRYTGNAKVVVIPDFIVDLSPQAFESCEHIEKIVIPKQLCEISERAFADCVGVKEYVVAPGNEEFMSINGDLYSKNGSTLLRYASGKTAESYEIPSMLKNSLNTIWNDAFSRSANLVKIDLGNADKLWVCARAFEKCANLRRVIFPDHLVRLGDAAFNLCESLEYVRLGDSLSIIEENAFRCCKSLKKIKFPPMLKNIKNQAFFRCVSLEKVDLPYGFRRWGGQAFMECSSLKKVTFRRGLISIGMATFYSCVSLESVELPDTVVFVEEQAFRGCENLSLKINALCLEETGIGAFEGVKEVKIVRANRR